jgi:hypothetical protein
VMGRHGPEGAVAAFRHGQIGRFLRPRRALPGCVSAQDPKCEKPWTVPDKGVLERRERVRAVLTEIPPVDGV